MRNEANGDVGIFRVKDLGERGKRHRSGLRNEANFGGNWLIRLGGRLHGLVGLEFVEVGEGGAVVAQGGIDAALEAHEDRGGTAEGLAESNFFLEIVRGWFGLGQSWLRRCGNGAGATHWK